MVAACKQTVFDGLSTWPDALGSWMFTSLSPGSSAELYATVHLTEMVQVPQILDGEGALWRVLWVDFRMALRGHNLPGLYGRFSDNFDMVLLRREHI